MEYDYPSSVNPSELTREQAQQKLDQALVDISRIPDDETRFLEYSRYLERTGLESYYENLYIRMQQQLILQEREAGLAYHHRTDIPDVLKSLSLVPSEGRLPMETRRAVSDIVTSVLAYYQVRLYYMAFHAMKSIGEGGYGHVYATSLVTEQDQYHLAVLSLQYLQGTVIQGNMIQLGSNAIAVKVYNSRESFDALIMKELSAFSTWVGWFIPQFYSVIRRYPMPWFKRESHGMAVSQEPWSAWDTMLLMEWCPGVPLASLDLDPDEAMKLEWVCHSALHYLYRRCGFIHNDLHANNLLLVPGPAWLPVYKPTLDPNGRPILEGCLYCQYTPVLLDFGRAMTDQYSYWTKYNNPFRGPEIDAFALYDIFGQRYPEPHALWYQQHPDSRASIGQAVFHRGFTLDEHQVDHTYFMQYLRQRMGHYLENRFPVYYERTPSYVQLLMGPEQRADFYDLLVRTRSILKKLPPFAIHSPQAAVQEYLRELVRIYL